MLTSKNLPKGIEGIDCLKLVIVPLMAEKLSLRFVHILLPRLMVMMVVAKRWRIHESKDVHSTNIGPTRVIWKSIPSRERKSCPKTQENDEMFRVIGLEFEVTKTPIGWEGNWIWKALWLVNVSQECEQNRHTGDKRKGVRQREWADVFVYVFKHATNTTLREEIYNKLWSSNSKFPTKCQPIRWSFWLVFLPTISSYRKPCLFQCSW